MNEYLLIPYHLKLFSYCREEEEKVKEDNMYSILKYSTIKNSSKKIDSLIFLKKWTLKTKHP